MEKARTAYVLLALIASIFSVLDFAGRSNAYLDGFAILIAGTLVAVLMLINRPASSGSTSRLEERLENPIGPMVERLKSAERGYQVAREEISSLIVSLYALRKEGRAPEDYNSVTLWKRKLLEWLGNDYELRSVIEAVEEGRRPGKKDTVYLHRLSRLIDKVRGA